ncbi:MULTISPECIES: GGDEF domain-containing protein [unclassified Shewanella]|uniref:tetratricopeptide repeat-containing diguanylate cyclase n=1 Tax=unclassified Shewanella TaxID=196818 RepID=UPI0006D6623E|nr:GGDEF domain-containing protein [Shewanella sp. P1-14-1]KPZ68757.1 putative diguanylate cyclase YedQ [Shewanella sp. P1-14-1]
MIKFISIAVFAFLFIGSAWANEVVTNASLSTEEMLREADSLRTKKPKRFNTLINALKAREVELNLAQKDYFNYLKGYQLAFNGEYKKAESIWVELSESNSSLELRFRANLSLINIFAYTKRWNEGLKYLEQNISNLHLIKDQTISNLGISAASIFYNQIGQYDLGLSYAQKLDSLSLHGRDLCVAKHQIVESKYHLGQLDVDSEDIKLAIESCFISDEIVWLNLINIFIAKQLVDEQKFREVIDLLESNISDIKRLKYVPSLFQFYALLSQSYYGTGQFTEAQNFANKTIELSVGMENTESEIVAFEVLYKVAVKENNFEEALKYYIKFAEADKAFFDDLKTKYLAFQLAQHKAVEQKVQIELLNKQNKLLQASQRLAESETENNRLFMALLIMVISLLSLASIRAKQTQKRLKRLAQYDSLTQIFNRGHFTSAAQEAITACQKNQDTISCILFDLDNFKGINDKHGHGCGDWVLKHVASTCDDLKRKQDIFARIGGEEFCVVLSNCNAEMAMNIAEDYRKAIAALDSSPSGYEFPISASFGVTDSQQSDYSLEALTSNADSAMYLAKHTGRNRVCNYADVESAKDADGVMI